MAGASWAPGGTRVGAGMHLVKRLSVFVATLLAAVGFASTQSYGNSNVQWQNYEAIGTVTNNDVQPATPTKEGFALNPSSTAGGIDAAKNSDGTLTIYIVPETKYYRCTASSGGSCTTYAPTTYDDVIQVGNNIQADGRYAFVNGQYQIEA